MMLTAVIWVLLVWNLIKLVVNDHFWRMGKKPDSSIAMFQAIESVVVMAVLWVTLSYV